MSATVTVYMPADEDGIPHRVYVPANAVVGGDGGGAYVWKVGGDPLTATMGPVITGPMTGSDIEIVEGLSPGDRIAVSGVQHLADGMRVRELTN